MKFYWFGFALHEQLLYIILYISTEIIKHYIQMSHLC
jgi:hypothetical protein